MDSHTYNWLQCALQSQVHPVDIKVESSLEPSAFPLLSPPSSPALARSVLTESTLFPASFPNPRRSHTSIARSKRVRPYPILTRDPYFLGEDTSIMANTWSPPGIKGGSSRTHFPIDQGSSNRRSSDGEQQVPSTYGIPNTFGTVSQTFTFMFLPNFV